MHKHMYSIHLDIHCKCVPHAVASFVISAAFNAYNVITIIQQFTVQTITTKILQNCGKHFMEMNGRGERWGAAQAKEEIEVMQNKSKLYSTK